MEGARARAMILLALSMLVAKGLAVPLTTEYDNQCARTCVIPDEPNFRYAPGTTYVYRYEASTLTTLQGAIDEGSGLHIEATAEFQVLTPCDMVVKLKDVSLYETDPQDLDRKMLSSGTREFKQALEEEQLRFAFQNGRIDDICPTAGEKTWALNIKRGILSAFQNSMSNLNEDSHVTEMDVAGNCEAHYTVEEKYWDRTTINKTKQLTGCTERHGQLTSIQTSPYYVDSDIQSLPLIDSSHHCQQIINNKILNRAYCKESHLFKPFSKDQAGAVTTTKQTLTYMESYIGAQSRMDYITHRTTMLFDHKYNGEQNKNYENEAEMVLREICGKAGDDIRPETPHMFTSLVYKLRELSADRLRSIYGRIDNICPGHAKAKQFFLDAIPMVGTTGSVSMIRELISSGQVTGVEAEMWLTSLAFLKTINKNMILEITPLLTNRADRKTVLSITSMVHSYCKVNTACAEESEVQTVISALEGMINSRCMVRSRQESDQIVMALKGLGNMGRVISSLPTIKRCFQESSNPIDVRLAAIEAFRRLPCTTNRDELLATYVSPDEDTEVRIASYLSVMACPTPDTITKIKETLQKEEVNQVGSFVWTHLSNLKETSDPMKREIREILEDHTLQETFNKDSRKFSRFYEGSLFSEMLNTGAVAEGSIVFSPESYIPRSGKFNMTVDLFGNSINLFEIGGRLQGMEFLLEKFFGPNGYFPEERVTNLLEGRQKKTPVSKVHNQFGLDMDEPQGNAYVKIFGNELRYWDFHGMEELLTMKDTLNYMDLILELSKEQNFELTKSGIFLDTSLIVPTLTGLPMNLSVNGSLSMNIKVNGKMDIRQIVASPRSCDVHGEIKPSAAIEVSSVMSVDGFVTSTGLKMVSTLHSSTAAKGKLQMEDGETFKLNIDIPNEKMELFSVESKFFVLHKHQERPQRGLDANRIDAVKCTSDKFAKWFGVQLCGEIAYPQPSVMPNTPALPFRGPANAAVYLTKRDNSMTGYEFETRFNVKKVRVSGVTQRVYNARLAFDTPQSQINREWTTDLIVNQPEKSLTFNLRTPYKKMSANGNYQWTYAMKTLNGDVTIDERSRYGVAASLEVDEQPYSMRYTPSLTVTMSGVEPVNLQGSVLLKEKNGVTVDLSLLNAFSEPVILKGDIGPRGSRQYTAAIDFASPLLKTHLESLTTLLDTTYASRASIDYTLLDNPQYNVAWNSKARDMSTSSLLKMDIANDITFTQYPALNSHFSWEIQKTTGHVENSLEFNFGKYSRSDRDMLKITQIYNRAGKMTDQQLTGKIHVLWPRYSIDWEANIDHTNNPRVLSNLMTARYAPGKQVQTIINLKNENTRLTKLSGDIQVLYPDNHMRLMQSVEETALGQYTTETIAHTSPDKQVNIRNNYSNRGSGRMLRHEASTEISIPGYQPVQVSGSLNGDGTHYSTNAVYQYGNERYTVNGEYQKKAGDVHGVSGNLVFPRIRVAASGDLSTGVQKALTFDITLNDPYRRNSRHITLDTRGALSYSQATGSFDLKWDADRDQSQALRIETSMANTDNSYRAELEMSYPGRTIRSAFNTDFSGELMNGQLSSNAEFEWARGKRIAAGASFSSRVSRAVNELQASVGFTTPFRDYENWSLNASHFNDNTQFRCIGGFAWAPTQKVALNVNGKMTSPGYYTRNGATKVNLSGRFTSPFRNFENLSSTYTYGYENLEHSVHLDAQWTRRDRLTFDTTSKRLGDGSYDATARFTSPFTNFEELSTKYTSRDENKAKMVHFDVQWSPREKVNFDGSFKFLPTRGNLMETTAVFTSPFRGLEMIAFNGHHDNNNARWTSNYELQYNSRDKMSLEVAAVYPSVDNLELKVTSMNPLKNIELYGKHEWANGKSTSKAYLRMDDQKIAIEETVSYQMHGNNLNFNSMVKFTSPFKNFEEIVLTLRHESDSTTLNSQLMLTHPRNRHSLTLEYSNNGDSYNSLITSVLRTTSTMYGSSATDLKYTADALKYDVVFNMQLPETPKYTITNHFAYTPIVDGEFSVKFSNNKPGSYYGGKQEYELGWAYSTNSREGTRGTVYYVWNDQKTELNGRFQNIQNNYITLEASIKSPYSGYESLEMMTSFRNQGNSDMTGTFSFDWAPRKKIEFSARLLNAYKKKVTVTFSSPFENFETLMFNSNFVEAERGNYNGLVSFQWNSRDKVTVTGHLNQYQQLELGFTSPFRGFESLTLEASQDPSTIRTMVQWAPTKKVVFTGSLSNQEITLHFTSPFRYYDDLTLITSYEIRNQDYAGDFSFQWATNKKITFGAAVRATPRTQKQLTLQWTSPFTNFEELSWDSRYEVKNEKHIITLSVEAGRNQNIDFTTSWRINLPYHKEFDMQLTGITREPLSFNSVYYLRNQAHSMNVNFKWESNKKVELSGEFAGARSDRKSASLSLKTPFPGYENLGFESSYTIAGDKYSSSITVHWINDQEIQMQGRFQLSSTKLDAEFTLATPFRDYENFRFATELSFVPNDYTATITTQWQRNQQIQLTGRYQATSSKLNAELTLTTPFRDYENTRLATEFVYAPSDYTAMITMQWQRNQQIKLIGHYKLTSSNLETELTVMTPFRDYENLKFTAGLGFERDFEYSTAISAKWAEMKQVEMSGMIKLTSTQLETELTITTPFREYNNYKMAAVVQYTPDDYEATLQFDYPYNGYNGRGIFGFTLINKEHKQFSIDAKTPFYPEFAFISSYDFDQNGHASITTLKYGQDVTNLIIKSNARRFNVEFTSPFTNFEDLQLGIDYNIRGFDYDATVTFTSSALSGRVLLTARLAGLKDLSISFSSPFRGFENIRFTSMYELTEQKYTSTAKLIYNRETIKLDTDIQYDTRRKSIAVTFTSPIPNMEYLMVSTEFGKRRDNYTGEFTFQWDQQRKIKVSGSVNNMDSFPKSFIVEVKTPFRGYQSQSLTTNLDRSPNGYRYGLIAEYNNGQTIEYSGTYTFDTNQRVMMVSENRFTMSPNTFVNFKLDMTHTTSGCSSGRYSSYGRSCSHANALNTELKTSFDAVPFVKYEHEYTYVESRKLSSKHKFSWSESQAIDIAYDLVALSDDIYNAQLSLNTPFRGYESYKMLTKTKYTPNKITQETTLQWPSNQHITSIVLYDYTTDVYIFDVETTSSFRDMRQFAFKTTCKPFEHTDNHASSFAMEMNGEQVYDLQLKFTDNSDSRTTRTTGDVQLRTKAFPVGVTYSVSVGDKDVELAGEFNWNLNEADKKVGAQVVSYDRSRGSDLNRRFRIETTYPSRTMFFNYELDKTSTRFTNEILFSWKRGVQMGYEVVLDDKSTRSKAIYDGKVAFSHPVRSVEFNLHHEKAQRQMTTAVEFNWDALRTDSQKARTILAIRDDSRGKALHHQATVTFEHPALRKAVVSQFEFVFNEADIILSTKAELEYAVESSQNIRFATTLRDVSMRDVKNYTLSASLLHPVMRVDSDIEGFVAYSPRAIEGAARFDYLTRRGQTINSVLRGRIDKIRKAIELEMHSPVKSAMFSGQYNTEYRGDLDKYTVSVTGSTDNGRPIRATLDLQNKPQKQLDLVVYYDPDNSNKKFEVHGGWESRSAFNVEASHSINGARTTDALYNTRLNNSHLMHTRLYWRPSAYSDIKETTERTKRSVSESFVNEWEAIRQQVEREVRGHYSEYQRHIDSTTEPFLTQTRREWSRLANDVSRYVDSLSTLYDNNEFFMRDTHKVSMSVYEAAERIFSEYSRTMAYYYEYYKYLLNREYTIYMRELDSKIQEYSVKFQQSYDENYVQMMRKYEMMKREATQKYDEYMATLNRNYDEGYQKLEVYSAEVMDKLYNKGEQLMNKASPYIQKYYPGAEKLVNDVIDRLNNAVMTLYNKVEGHPYYQHASSIKDTVSGHMRNGKEYMSDFGSRYSDMFNDYSSKYGNMYDDIANHPTTQLMKDHASWILDTLNLKENAVKFSQVGIEQGQKVIEDTVRDLVHQYIRPDISHVTVYEPEQGEIQYEQYLPFEMKTLDEIPEVDVESLPYYSQIKAQYEKYEPYIANYSMLDTYYKYKPTLDINNWIPPFKAQAMLIGSQHFVTFDNTFYDFAGQCSYVLAHDFIDANFSVIVNYQKQGREVSKRSMVVLSDNRQIEITPDYRVNVDGENQEMPIEFDNTMVRRMGPTVRIDNRRGVSIVCNWQRDICTLHMSGWYFGKTAGLWGTYNNEKNDDFLTASRQRTTDVNTFTSSWNLDESCRSSNMATVVPVEVDTAGYRACAAYFQEQSSPFRACFSQVDTSAFFDMCVTDVTKKGDYVTGMCSIADAYISECRRQGIDITMPDTCVTCEGVTGTFNKGETVTVNGGRNTRSSDVVFIVENQECNRDTGSQLNNVVKQLEKQLRNQGLMRNRYAVVGFGGEGVHDLPHVHTGNGKIFNDFRGVSGAIESLPYFEEKNSDIFEAIAYAAGLPFRSGISKTFVLLTCSECNPAQMKLDYSAMLSFLIEHDITLHIAKDHSFKLRAANKKKASMIVGIDGNSVYTLKDQRDKVLAGDKALYQQLQIPKDICVALAQETNGTMFNADKLTTGRMNHQKKYRDVFARRIAMTAEPNGCQICTCEDDEFGVGYSDCRPCVEPKRFAIIQAEGVDMEGDNDVLDNEDDNGEDVRFKVRYEEYRKLPNKKRPSKKSARKLKKTRQQKRERAWF
ncbi:PREDICTED: uncharacterized protein LOC106814086 [Priapulus caudatus]|uniref:Uncharacterized protein LOC106814086 n=1 Tax=Priapulus caudatus TaxID=37621 RepID=A0ABM1ENS8_PRICU|nr:PREDICTED: uncharacterized protein LOC106814086 [Priapulus caudatus]